MLLERSSTSSSGSRGDEKSFFGEVPLSRPLLEAVSGDAIGVLGASFDPEALCATLQTLARAEMGDENWNAALKSAQEKHSFDLSRDVCRAIGSSAVVYLGPVHALGTPPLVAMAEVETGGRVQTGWPRGAGRGVGVATRMPILT